MDNHTGELLWTGCRVIISGCLQQLEILEIALHVVDARGKLFFISNVIFSRQAIFTRLYIAKSSQGHSLPDDFPMYMFPMSSAVTYNT